MTDRLKWIVLSRAAPAAEWTAYGPMTPTEALTYCRGKVGSSIECKVALLLPTRPLEEPMTASAEPFDAQENPRTQ